MVEMQNLFIQQSISLGEVNNGRGVECIRSLVELDPIDRVDLLTLRLLCCGL